MGLVLSGLIVGALVGFAIGARIASPTPGTPSPPPSAPVADVRPDAVSQRLRDAYYGSGSSVVACVVAGSLTCVRASISQTARNYSDITRTLDAAEMAAITPVRVPAGRIIVAGDFGPADEAAFARVDAAGPVDGRLLLVVNPDRQGIDYVDLGDLATGSYLVSISVPSFHVPTVLIEVVVA